MMIRKLLSERGDISSLRVVLLFSFFSVLSVWVWLSLKTQVMLAIPESIISLLGLLLATKWFQKTEEIKET